MINTSELVYLLIFLPLVSALLGLILKLIPHKVPKKVFFGASTFFAFCSFVLSAILLTYVITYQGFVLEDNTPVCIIQNIGLYFGFYLDNLTSVFLVLASGLFLVANIFSYRQILRGVQGFERFYIYLNFMEFFTLCFFVSSNLVQSIVFMMMGALMQYLFVNFYFQKPSAQKDSRRIFEINILADSILLTAAIVFLYFSTLTPDMVSVPTLGYNNINSLGLYSFAGLNPLLFVFVCILFSAGSLIKSSQFPFLSKMHLSSEAPNPVFSLFLTPVILGEGIFLLLRLYPLLNLTPVLFEILKIVGIISAILAALIALKETHLKKIMAFAAVSQAGIAICALGFKMYGACVFHLLCSGLSIALLSYCLDIVSYSSGSQENIKFLGGLREKLPLAAYPFLLGAVSLSGFTFSCFYSRSLILNTLSLGGSRAYLGLLLLCIFLTTFYIFRVYFRVFEGDYKGSYDIIKPSRLMSATVIILAIIALSLGFVLNNYIVCFVSLTGDCPIIQANLFTNIAAFIASAIAYYLAYKIYFTKQLKSMSIRPLRKIAANRFALDKFINFIFEDFIMFFANIFSFTEKYIIGFIYCVPKFLTRFLSYLSDTLKTKKNNAQMLSAFLTLTAFVMIIVIIYFKTGALK